MNKKITVSRTLCETSKDYIKQLINKNNKNNKNNKTSKFKTKKTDKTDIYNNYNNYIKKIVKSFVNSQHTLLNTIFKIKNDCQFDITYK